MQMAATAMLLLVLAALLPAPVAAAATDASGCESGISPSMRGAVNQLAAAACTTNGKHTFRFVDVLLLLVN